MSNKAIKRLIISVLALIVVVVLVSSCTVQVPTGNTAIITTFGKVEDYTLEAGFHFKSPFQEIILMDNREQKTPSPPRPSPAISSRWISSAPSTTPSTSPPP